jgi:hypothetical protein
MQGVSILGAARAILAQVKGSQEKVASAAELCGTIGRNRSLSLCIWHHSAKRQSVFSSRADLVSRVWNICLESINEEEDVT